MKVVCIRGVSRVGVHMIVKVYGLHRTDRISTTVAEATVLKMPCANDKFFQMESTF